MTVDTGPLKVAISPQTGFIEKVWLEGELIADAQGKRTLFMDIFRSPTHSPYQSLPQGELTQSTLKDVTVGEVAELPDGSIEVTSNGIYDNGTDSAFELKIIAEKEKPYIRIRHKCEFKGDPTADHLVALGFHLPLKLAEGARFAMGAQSRVWPSLIIPPRYSSVPPEKYPYWCLGSLYQSSPNHFRLWKATGDDVTSLNVEQGQRARNWLDASDSNSGAAIGIKNLAEIAPAELRVDTRNGGVISAYLYSPQAKPLLGNQSAAFSEQEAVIYFHKGDFEAGKVEETFANLGFPKDLAEIEIPKSYSLKSTIPRPKQSFPIIGSIPIPRGDLKDENNVRLIAGGALKEGPVSGEIPLQSKAIVYWPDGSIKWLLLSFFFDENKAVKVKEGSGEGKEVVLNVNEIDGTSTEFTLLFGDKVKKGEVENPLKVVERGQAVSVDTGAIKFEVRKGAGGFLDKVWYEGRLISNSSGERTNFLDMVKANSYKTNDGLIQGELDASRAYIYHIDVVERGPIRAELVLRGRYHMRTPSDFIVYLDCYAGRPYIEVKHFFYFAGDMDEDFIANIGLSLPLEFDILNAYAGGEEGPVEIAGVSLASLRQNSHLDYDICASAGPGEAFDIKSRGARSAGWLSTAGRDTGVTVVIRNIWEEYPKEILIDAAQKKITAYSWPATYRPLDLRRYSRLCYRALGEICVAADQETRKLLAEAYPIPITDHHISTGVGKTTDLLLYFHEADAGGAQSHSVARHFQDRPLLYASSEYNCATEALGPMEPYNPKKFPATEERLASFQEMIEAQVRYRGWYGMIDYGDIGHMYNTRDHVWYYDIGRWGWTNTEGLPGLHLWNMYFRTGKHSDFKLAEAMARHNRDVDTFHSGPWRGHGSRHNVNHWGDGGKMDRASIFTGQRIHYSFTGSRRAYDHFMDIGRDYFFLSGPSDDVGVDTFGSRTIAALTLWEITGDERYHQILHNALHYIVDNQLPDGRFYYRPMMDWSRGRGIKNWRDELGLESMFFHNFGSVHSLFYYYFLTGDEAVGEFCRKLAEGLKLKRHHYNRSLSFIVAYKHSGDERYARALDIALDYYITTPKETWAASGVEWSGSTISVLYFNLNVIPYVLGFLPMEGEWPEFLGVTPP